MHGTSVFPADVVYTALSTSFLHVYVRLVLVEQFSIGILLVYTVIYF